MAERKNTPPAFTAASREEIMAALKKLSYKEREILKLRYGWTPDGIIYTLEEVGHIFKVTRERIRSIEKKGSAKLVAILEERPRGTCETCRFWDTAEHPEEEGQMQLGNCRKHAPHWLVGSSKALLLGNCCVPGKESEESADYTSIAAAVWPETRCLDWCGEHQPHPATAGAQP